MYFVRDLKKGSIIKKSDFRRIRPGFGLKPKYADLILNKKVKKDITRGDRVSWDILTD